MRRWKLAGLLTLAALAASGCGLLSPPPPAQEAPPTIQAADQQLRESLNAALQEAALELNMSIQTGDAAYVSRADLIVAHALVTGFDALQLREPDRIADVGLAYLELPDGARVKQTTGERTPIRDGYYKV